MEEITVKKAEAEVKAIKAKFLLMALDTDMQSLANEIGADRSNLHKVIAGERKGTRIRAKLAKAVCTKVEALFLDPETEEPQAKAA